MFLGQIVVNYDNATNLVNNVLLGNGVVASNITYNGSALQLGYFDASGINLGISSGVVIGTNDIIEIEPPGLGGMIIPNTVNDPDLLDIANSVPPLIGQPFLVSGVNDIAILEFDFEAISDNVEFRFIFTSEEYEAYENTGFNDVFAFLISGPGITGPYQSPLGFPNGAQNIAVVPGSNPPLPITISSVNGILNNNFYVQNFNPGAVNVTGYTVPLTASADVICGETYHIKLAIADGSDQSFPSYILLEEGSFSAVSNIDISAQASYITPDLGPNQVYEGCGTIDVSIQRSDNSQETTLYFIPSGNAVEGVDYVDFPDSATFAVGQDEIILQIEPIFDGIDEGVDTITFALEGNCVTSAVLDSLFIIDPPPIEVMALNDTAGCPGDSTQVGIQVNQGVPGFTYHWSNGVQDSTGDYSNYVWLQNTTNTQSLVVTVTDGCGIYYGVQDVMLTSYDPTIDLFVPDFKACENTPVEVFPTISGGVSPYNYWWESAMGNSGTGKTIDVFNGDTYTLYVSDLCPSDTASHTFTVGLFDPISILPIDNINHDCPGTLFAVNPFFEGGSGSYFYTYDGWQNTLSDSVLIDTPLVTTTYTIEVTDKCFQDTATTQFTVTVDPYIPIELAAPDSLIGCFGEYLAIDGSVLQGGVAPFDYQWSYAPVNTDRLSVLLREDEVIYVTVTDGCGNIIKDTVVVHVPQPEVSFDIAYYDLDDVEFTSTLSEDVVSIWWDFGDGTTGSDSIENHGYQQVGEYTVTLWGENLQGCVDSVSNTVISQVYLYIPNAFTPNENLHNPLWKPIHNGLKGYELSIYDRWGKRIFQTTNPDKHWDGRFENGDKAEQGTYLYKLKARSVIDDEKMDRSGFVMLIR